MKTLSNRHVQRYALILLSCIAFTSCSKNTFSSLEKDEKITKIQVSQELMKLIPSVVSNDLYGAIGYTGNEPLAQDITNIISQMGGIDIYTTHSVDSKNKLIKVFEKETKGKNPLIDVRHSIKRITVCGTIDDHKVSNLALLISDKETLLVRIKGDIPLSTFNKISNRIK